MFSALPRTAPQSEMIKLCAISTLELLKAHAVSTGDTVMVDYEHSHMEAQVRFLERIQHGFLRKPSAQELHESWLNLMYIDDWKHGRTYCPIAKTDPHLVGFDALDDTRRFKDQLVLCSILHVATS